MKLTSRWMMKLTREKILVRSDSFLKSRIRERDRRIRRRDGVRKNVYAVTVKK